MAEYEKPVRVSGAWSAIADDQELTAEERNLLNEYICKSIGLRDMLCSRSDARGIDDGRRRVIWRALIAGWADTITKEWGLP
jgi:hypothetical protein